MPHQVDDNLRLKNTVDLLKLNSPGVENAIATIILAMDDLKFQDENGDTIVHHLIRNKPCKQCDEALNMLLKQCWDRDPEIFSIANNNNDSAFEIAVQQRLLSAATLIIEHTKSETITRLEDLALLSNNNCVYLDKLMREHGWENYSYLDQNTSKSKLDAKYKSEGKEFAIFASPYSFPRSCETHRINSYNTSQDNTIVNIVAYAFKIYLLRGVLRKDDAKQALHKLVDELELMIPAAFTLFIATEQCKDTICKQPDNISPPGTKYTIDELEEIFRLFTRDYYEIFIKNSKLSTKLSSLRQGSKAYHEHTKVLVNSFLLDISNLRINKIDDKYIRHGFTGLPLVNLDAQTNTEFMLFIIKAVHVIREIAEYQSSNSLCKAKLLEQQQEQILGIVAGWVAKQVDVSIIKEYFAKIYLYPAVILNSPDALLGFDGKLFKIVNSNNPKLSDEVTKVAVYSSVIEENTDKYKAETPQSQAQNRKRRTSTETREETLQQENPGLLLSLPPVPTGPIVTGSTEEQEPSSPGSKAVLN